MEKLDAIQEDLKTKATSTELLDLVIKLNEKEERIVALETRVESLENELKSSNVRIDELAGRLVSLECSKLTNEHLNLCTSDLLSRKIDDQEQVSRKVNLRVVGLPIERNESPDTLLTQIKAECEKLQLGLCDADFDHCHRNGKILHDGDVAKQSVLLKMRSWRARNIMFENRKKFKFKLYHDLTIRRRELLDETNKHVQSADVKDVVLYTFADKNCKLKIRAVNGRYLHFSSLDEFLSLVDKLQRDSLDKAFHIDERDEVFC